MADHSVCARDELNGNEASEALMFCFDNAFNSREALLRCRFGPFVSSFLRVFVFLNAGKKKRVEFSTAEKVLFFSVSRSLLKRRQGVHDH